MDQKITLCRSLSLSYSAGLGTVKRRGQSRHPVGWLLCLAPAQQLFTRERGRVHGKVSNKSLVTHSACDWGLVLTED